MLGIPPKAISLDGHLGLAFGARGGGRFAAHYEPGKLVINLTKLSGAGSGNLAGNFLGGHFDEPNILAHVLERERALQRRHAVAIIATLNLCRELSELGDNAVTVDGGGETAEGCVHEPLQVMARLRDMLGHNLPALFLTGDISTKTLSEIAGQGYSHRTKPIGAEDLTQLIQSLLPTRP